MYQIINSLEKLSTADIDDIIDIIRPIGTFNKKANNIISISKSLLNDKNGIVPNDRTYLESLDGVGRKTTNVVLSNLYNVPCIAVDTHVSRVSQRLGIAKTTDDVLKIEKKLNSTHYGMEDAKNRIVEYIAVKSISPDVNSPIICLVGPPGVGKTTFAESISAAISSHIDASSHKRRLSALVGLPILPAALILGTSV